MPRLRLAQPFLKIGSVKTRPRQTRANVLLQQLEDRQNMPFPRLFFVAPFDSPLVVYLVCTSVEISFQEKARPYSGGFLKSPKTNQREIVCHDALFASPATSFVMHHSPAVCHRRPRFSEGPSLPREADLPEIFPDLPKKMFFTDPSRYRTEVRFALMTPPVNLCSKTQEEADHNTTTVNHFGVVQGCN